MFGSEVNVDDAPAFVGRTHGEILASVLIDVAEIRERESESFMRELAGKS